MHSLQCRPQAPEGPPRPTEAITKYSWSDGKNNVRIYIALDGLDDVSADALKAEHGERSVFLDIASVVGKRRRIAVSGLSHDIDSVNIQRNKGRT